MNQDIDFSHIKYDSIKAQIVMLHEEKGNTWNAIKELSFLNDPIDKSLEFISRFAGFEGIITRNEWQKLVDSFKANDKSQKVNMLGKNTKNDAKISQDPGSQWQQYKKKLGENGFSLNSITNLQRSTYEIMQRLDSNTINSRPIKGLVIGNVQSGKTANMAGLISMAADYGFNYFIIFSGVIDKLREQTANRLYGDLKSNGNLNWTAINNPSVSTKSPEAQWENIDLNEKNRNRYFTVCLKNKSRIEALNKWLYSDANKLKQLKVLIIDDEADQASVNTKHTEGEERTTINKSLIKLVNGNKNKKLKAVNYISYTATPYANVLNESGLESLYPRDFIFSLEPSEDYIGPQQIFGLQEPESHPSVDIVRSISQNDYLKILEIHKGKESELPESFKEAIDWFFLTGAAVRAIGYKKPVSMLVHTSQRIIHHELIANVITKYLLEIHENKISYFEKLEDLYNKESIDFTKEDFLEGMPKYSHPERVPEYPEWNLVLRHLKRVLSEHGEKYVSHIRLNEDGIPTYHSGFHIIIDNSRTKANDQIVRLVYPTDLNKPKLAPMFIVVGGNTLSRGLTLEGLTTTYFLRTTNQADTLMQMGRWFGYRSNYEIFPRVWMNSIARERFEFLSQLNEELKEDIADMSTRGQSPEDLGPRIKNSPNQQFIKITANNKMWAAKPTDLDFTGFNKQTVLFTNDKIKLENNLRLTEEFLNTIDKVDGTSKRGHMIWHDISYKKIRLFLEKFEFCQKDIAFTNIGALLDWYDQVNTDNKFSDWSVILSSVGDISEYKKGKTDLWNIQGYSPSTVTRTRRGDIQEDKRTVSIGSLRNPTDLYMDIPEIKDVSRMSAKTNELRRVREEYGYSTVPQLLLYRIDKGQMTEEEFREKFPKKNNRHPLNFDEDIIGMNIMIPGISHSTNMAKYVTIDLTELEKESVVNEENFKEED